MNNTYSWTWDTQDTQKNSTRIARKALFEIFNRNLMKSGKGRVLDFGSLEVQSVYISGNLTGPFTAYLEEPTPEFSWKQAFRYPKPDYLSSSRKRLIPQIIAMACRQNFFLQPDS